MSITALVRCLIGIEKLIDAREYTLKQMRTWYNNPRATTIGYTNMLSFYSHGIKTMRELGRLHQIKRDIYQIIERHV